MASAFSAILQIHPEVVFNHSDHEIFGQASVYSATIGPSGVMWNQSSLLSFPDVLEHPEATQVTFVFEASDADYFACQIDGYDVDCVSPYTTPNLQPGNHIFQATPKTLTNQMVSFPNLSSPCTRSSFGVMSLAVRQVVGVVYEWLGGCIALIRGYMCK